MAGKFTGGKEAALHSAGRVQAVTHPEYNGVQAGYRRSTIPSTSGVQVVTHPEYNGVQAVSHPECKRGTGSQPLVFIWEGQLSRNALGCRQGTFVGLQRSSDTRVGRWFWGHWFPCQERLRKVFTRPRLQDHQGLPWECGQGSAPFGGLPHALLAHCAAAGSGWRTPS